MEPITAIAEGMKTACALIIAISAMIIALHMAQIAHLNRIAICDEVPMEYGQTIADCNR